MGRVYVLDSVLIRLGYGEAVEFVSYRPKTILNRQRVVQALANELYYMELNGEPCRRLWAYRRAAWAIEDTHPDLGRIYQANFRTCGARSGGNSVRKGHRFPHTDHIACCRILEYNENGVHAVVKLF